MKVTITQFMRPDGRENVLSLEIPDRFQSKVDLIEKMECRITCEQLMDGAAAQYISHELGDVLIKLTPPYDKDKAESALFEMLGKFTEELFNAWFKSEGGR